MGRGLLTARLLATCSGLALAAGLAPAYADTVSLDAKTIYSVDGSGSTTVEQSTPAYAFPNIYPSATGTSGSTIFGHVYSSQPTGSYEFGSRSSGSKNFSNVGTATFTDSFTAGSAGPYSYDFTIDAGDLNVSLPSSNNGTQYAALSLMITETVDGGMPSLLFDYESSFSANTPGGIPVFHESGATLNPSGPTTSAGYGDYSFSQYNTSVSLGTLAAGQNVTVNEVLVSTAIGTSTNCSSGSGIHTLAVRLSVVGGGGGAGGTCGTSLARIGDPPQIVPEPASFAAIGVGLAGLAFARRRRPGVMRRS